MQIAIIVILALLVIAAVAWPLLRSTRGHHTDAQEFAVQPPSAPAAAPERPAAPDISAAQRTAARRSAAPADAPTGDAALEADIARYREALTTGTLCPRCGEANPVEAKFCRECGKALPASAAQEFAK